MKTKFIVILIFSCLLVGSLQSQWVPDSIGMSDKVIYALASNSNYIFAGTLDYGVYHSSNNGINWTSTS